MELFHNIWSYPAPNVHVAHLCAEFLVPRPSFLMYDGDESKLGTLNCKLDHSFILIIYIQDGLLLEMTNIFGLCGIMWNLKIRPSSQSHMLSSQLIHRRSSCQLPRLWFELRGSGARKRFDSLVRKTMSSKGAVSRDHMM